jgi:hypothetical protein
MQPIHFWVPLNKVNADKRLVYGYASTPALDLQGERVSLEAIKRALPDYMQWRNIREMHQMSAVGVAESADVDQKGLYLVGRIVDDEAWNKVKSGVYKGFSIGGQRVSKNGEEITELLLTEISLVDRPANPECRIELYKRDALGGTGAAARQSEGAQSVSIERAEVGLLGRLIAKLAGAKVSEKMSSHAPDAVGAEHDLNRQPVGPRPEDARRAGDEGGMTWSPYDDAYAALNRILRFTESDGFAAAGLEPDLIAEEYDPAVALDGYDDGDHDDDHDDDAPGADGAALCDDLFDAGAPEGKALGRRGDVSDGDRRRALVEYGAVEFADPSNRKYPLDTPEHIRAAWSYFAMPRNRRFYTPEERRQIENRIIAAWKRKIDPDGPPAARAREQADSELSAGGAGGSAERAARARRIARRLARAAHQIRIASGQSQRGEDHMGASDPGKVKGRAGDHRRSLHRASIHFSKAAKHQQKAVEHHGMLVSAHKAARHALTALHKVLKEHHEATAADKADKGAADSVLMSEMARGEFPHDLAAEHLAAVAGHLGKAAEHASLEGSHAARAVEHHELGLHHLNKAMAVWIGEHGEAPGDAYPGLYDVPPGVHPMAQDELTEGDVPDYDLRYPYPEPERTLDIPPYSTPPAALRQGAAGGAISSREAELMRKAAYLEGKLAGLANTPAKPRAQLFSVGKQMLGGELSRGQERVAELLDGVNENEDPLRASARILGNMALKGIGARSTFDPSYRGAAGGSRLGALPTRA